MRDLQQTRRDLGALLAKERERWPSARAMMGGARGPDGLSWREYLKRHHGISESTASRCVREAQKPLSPTASTVATVGTRHRDCVYFIQGASGGPIKIGTSRDVEDRIRGLQSCSPVRLVLLGVAAGDIRLERALHRRLAPHRLHGEWFADAPEVKAAIAEVLQ